MWRGEGSQDYLYIPLCSVRVGVVVGAGGLEPSTQGAIFKTLRAAVGAARDAGLTGGGDFLLQRLADLPIRDIEPKEARLHAHQVGQVADHMVATVEREPMLGMLLMLMLSFGVRIGETRQARWENFDLGSVRKEMSQTPHGTRQ